ncbi:hypothetical protein [Streptomyces termitum]|uniref:hypothetical protein n=1 Tax=Streptomyces termitum TaxID=67368 RepID=UPI00378BDB52
MRVLGIRPRPADGGGTPGTTGSRATAARPVRLLTALITAVTAAVALVLAGSAPAWAYYPVLSVSLTPSTVVSGNTVTIRVTSVSDAAYSHARIGLYAGNGVRLDAITSVVSCSTSCSEAVGLGYFAQVGDLAPGDPIDITVTLKVDPGVPPQSFPVRHQFLTSGQGNAGTVNGPVLTVTAPPADLAVGLEARPRLAVLAPSVAYTLTATNNGPGAVSSATLTAELPAGTRATDLSPECTVAASAVTCAYGAIAPGATVSRTFDVPVSLLRIGPVTVTAARAAGSPDDPDATNDTAAVTCTTVSIALVVCP